MPGVVLAAGDRMMNNNCLPTLQNVTVAASLAITGTGPNTLHKLVTILTGVERGRYSYDSPF